MTFAFHRLAILIVCLLGFYARAATVRYIIYPIDDLERPLPQQFTEMLNELAGPQGNVYTSVRHRYDQEIRFWCADLTETAFKALLEKPEFRATVKEIRSNKVVMELFTQNELLGKNGTYLFRPTSEMTPSNLSASEGNFQYKTQESPVAAELRALSQPLNSGSINHYPNYVYQTGGRPTYIYHVELGINEQHDDFRGRKIEWLYTDLSLATGASTKTEAAAGGGHSTCTASKAVGNLYGASKSATLVVVKMPNLEEASVYEVLDTVIDDINDKHRTRTSVVSVSWGTKAFYPAFHSTSLGKRLLDQINELMIMDVLFVCAAGNAALKANHRGDARLLVDTFPAFLTFYLEEERFIAVGNSDINGARHQTSQIHLQPVQPQIYAPGVDIKCASSTSSTGYGDRTWTGTSFSAPLVAGVIADLMSTGQYNPRRPFWWQRPGGQNVIWNLVDNENNPPVLGSGNATLVNYTAPNFATTGFGNEQLDVSTE